jgi:disulfide bond formation protein DsbB
LLAFQEHHMVVIRCFSILFGCYGIVVTGKHTVNHMTVENPSRLKDLNFYCTYIKPELSFDWENLDVKQRKINYN